MYMTVMPSKSWSRYIYEDVSFHLNQINHRGLNHQQIKIKRNGIEMARIARRSEKSININVKFLILEKRLRLALAYLREEN